MGNSMSNRSPGNNVTVKIKNKFHILEYSIRLSVPRYINSKLVGIKANFNGSRNKIIIYRYTKSLPYNLVRKVSKRLKYMPRTIFNFIVLRVYGMFNESINEMWNSTHTRRRPHNIILYRLILSVLEASIKHYYCVRDRENSAVVKINENKRRRWAGNEIEVIRLPNLFWTSKVLCGKSF